MFGWCSFWTFEQLEAEEHLAISVLRVDTRSFWRIGREEELSCDCWHANQVFGSWRYSAVAVMDLAVLEMLGSNLCERCSGDNRGGSLEVRHLDVVEWLLF